MAHMKLNLVQTQTSSLWFLGSAFSLTFMLNRIRETVKFDLFVYPILLLATSH